MKGSGMEKTIQIKDKEQKRLTSQDRRE